MRYQLHPNAAFRQVAGEVFIVTADRAMHQFTTPTALAVFHSMQKTPATVDEIALSLSQGFEVSVEQAAKDVASFIETLVDRQIVAPFALDVAT